MHLQACVYFTAAIFCSIRVQANSVVAGGIQTSHISSPQGRFPGLNPPWQQDRISKRAIEITNPFRTGQPGDEPASEFPTANEAPKAPRVELPEFVHQFRPKPQPLIPNPTGKYLAEYVKSHQDNIRTATAPAPDLDPSDFERRARDLIRRRNRLALAVHQARAPADASMAGFVEAYERLYNEPFDTDVPENDENGETKRSFQREHKILLDTVKAPLVETGHDEMAKLGAKRIALEEEAREAGKLNEIGILKDVNFDFDGKFAKVVPKV